MFNIFLNLLLFHKIKIFFLNLLGNRIGSGCSIHHKVYITKPFDLHMKSNVTVNFGCYLDTRGKIYIGNNVMIGHKCRIYTAGHDIQSPLFEGLKKEVVIKDNVVVFPNCIIMPGITIEEGGVALPGSVITKNIPAYEVHGGNPAKKIKERKRDINYKIDYRYIFTNA